MKTMKAVRYHSIGKVEDVMKIEDVPIPKPGPGEVLVKVYAAGMNPVNYKLIEGVLGMFSPKLPSGDGLDVSGVVVELGAGVSRFIEGDEVWGLIRYAPFKPLYGSFAEYAVISELNLYRKPVEISHEEAASLGVVAFTGYQSLINLAKLKKDQKVLILGASGGTGTFGVQLAKKVCGAYVAATCSNRNRELVTSLGADLIINYTEENWAEVLKGQNYDVIYDCRGGETYWNDAKFVLKKSTGHFVTIVGDHSEQQPLTLGNLTSTGLSIASRKFGSIFGGIKYDYAMPNVTLDQFQNITKWVQTGVIKAIVDRVIPFENILEAYQYQHSGRAVGKIVVSMQNNDLLSNNDNLHDDPNHHHPPHNNDNNDNNGEGDDL